MEDRLLRALVAVVPAAMAPDRGAPGAAQAPPTRASA
jgi:hypothetical protein